MGFERSSRNSCYRHSKRSNQKLKHLFRKMGRRKKELEGGDRRKFLFLASRPCREEVPAVEAGVSPREVALGEFEEALKAPQALKDALAHEGLRALASSCRETTRRGRPCELPESSRFRKSARARRKLPALAHRIVFGVPAHGCWSQSYPNCFGV